LPDISQPKIQPKKILQDTRRHLKRAKRRAERELQKDLADKCYRYEFTNDPKQACQIYKDIQQGFTGHLPKIVDNKIIKQNGEQANSDTENAYTVHSHFTKVFDRSDVPINLSILAELESPPIDEKVRSRLDILPDKDELLKAIQKMNNSNAAGITLVTSYMLKVLPPTVVDYLITQVIRKKRKGLDCDEWHIIKFAMLYKGKGKKGDTNNWRGIFLKELT
jgi:hypothetical protein